MPIRILVLMIWYSCWKVWDLKSASKAATIVFSKEGVEEIINIQPTGGKAKPYQVKQVRGIVLKYRLSGE